METRVQFLLLLIGSNLVHTTIAHGQMFEPPSRASAFRLGYPTPQNYNYDMQMNCGGFYNQWGRNGGKCGICGDPYQGPRQYEAGGIFATGLIVRNYTEGQLIDVHLNIRVGHGGWSEIRLCPNNDIHKPATQACLDRYQLALEDGTTRITHSHDQTGLFKYKMRLPQGLTCTQCVIQWRWNTDSNNHGCNGCGAQEQFYACADIAIRPSSSGSHVTTYQTLPTRTTQRPTVRTLPSTPVYHTIGVFYPGWGVKTTTAPPVSSCTASISGYQVFGPATADDECRRRCVNPSTCPLLLCSYSCTPYSK